VNRGRAVVDRLASQGGLAVLMAGLLAASCSGASVAGDDDGLAPLTDDWRGVLLSGGGELPFDLRVDPEGTDPPAVVLNAGVETSLVAVTRQGAASYTLRFFGDAEPIDSELVVKMAPNGDELHGFWRLRHASDTAGSPHELVTQMPFSATRNDERRFQRNDPTLEIASAESIAALADVTGEWTVSSASEGIALHGNVRFIQEGERVFSESAADASSAAALRMEGIYRNGLLRLSLFDGYRAALLHARATPAGTFEGRVWIADQPAAAWSARRVATDR
jgi:hypothetical protein